ncbi:MAG: hypothetical protein JW944_03335 [Deltaproteobacteria bacterium]|nr:hypothetical protein [Deltaproteobacteria bacterium]
MEEKKGCFGILDNVFPISDNGLREVPAECFQCPDRISCLKTAVSTEEGIKMREGVLDRAAKDGVIGRLQRWSRKKELHRLLKQQEKKKKYGKNNLPKL